MFSEGDLVHIPQGVTMIRQFGSNLRYITTTKPQMAVFLKYISWSTDAEVAMTDGYIWHVPHKKLSFKEQHVS